MKRIYLDYAATTPVRKEVLEAMTPYFSERYGNASSLHSFGREAAEALEASRSVLAKKLSAKPEELIFTSGGTESNNLAVKGIAYAYRDKGRHIITSKIEHSSILNPCRWLQQDGYEVTYLEADSQGLIDPSKLEASIRPDTVLVSIGHGNNEIGTMQDLRGIGEIARKKGTLFHTDACQSFAKHPIDVGKDNVDLVTINSHKIYGPKGVGALCIRNGAKITPIEHGGQHERRLRGGTENVAGIVGFARAAEAMKEEDVAGMRSHRDILIKSILSNIRDSRLNGHPTQRLCNNANFTFNAVEGEALLLRLDMRGVACSTGSACSSHSLQPSHVLLGIGLPPEECHGSLRCTTGLGNSMEDINYAASVIGEEVEKLRKISPFGKK